VAPHQTPLGELTALSQTLKLDLGAASQQGGGDGLGSRRERVREGEWRGGKGRAPQSLATPLPQSSPNVEILAWITSKNVNVLYISNVLWR